MSVQSRISDTLGGTPPGVASRLESRVASAPTDPGRLRVLVIDEDLPSPPDSGKRIRTWNLLRRLAARHAISLLCYGHPNSPAVAATESAGIHVHLVEPQREHRRGALYARLFANLFSPYPYSVAKHYSRRFQLKLEQLLRTEQFDLVQCEWTPYARFLDERHALPVLLASHNVESQIWIRRARRSRTLLEKLFFVLQGIKMRSFERRALHRAAQVTAVSPQDAELMRAWGARAVTLVPNGVDVEFFQPASEPTASELLFLASLDWQPNLDALDYFLREILPLVRARHPATLRIVGRRPSPLLRERLAGLPGVELVGEVDDVRPHLARAAVVVVPLRIGGGSRIKILEALAAGRAVVSTSMGAEGLDVIAGTHLHIANQPREFAERTLGLLASSEERRRLGGNGRRLVVEQYNWNGIADALESAWLEACRGARMVSAASAVPRPPREML